MIAILRKKLLSQTFLKMYSLKQQISAVTKPIKILPTFPKNISSNSSYMLQTNLLTRYVRNCNTINSLTSSMYHYVILGKIFSLRSRVRIPYVLRGLEKSCFLSDRYLQIQLHSGFNRLFIRSVAIYATVALVIMGSYSGSDQKFETGVFVLEIVSQ